MPNAKDIEAFFSKHPDSPLCKYSLEEVQGWLSTDLEYMRRPETSCNGIEMAQDSLGSRTFDLVLIDGSEFTGESELDKLYGSTYVLLDDTRTFKNWSNFVRLSNDPNYQVIEEDATCRNGFAAFKRTLPSTAIKVTG
jgi:hypothetical protein